MSREFYTLVRRGIAPGLLGVLLLSQQGCSADKTTSPAPAPTAPEMTASAAPLQPPTASSDRLTCNQLEKARWQHTPSQLANPVVANLLGVEVVKLSGGSFGPVHCDGTMTAKDIERPSAKSVIHVTDLKENCLVVGLISRPEPGVHYHDVLAVCPGDEPTATL